MIFILAVKIDEEEEPRKAFPVLKDTGMSPWQHFPFFSFHQPLTVHATGPSVRTSLRLTGIAHHILPWFHWAVGGLCANIPEYQNPGVYWKYAVTLTFWPF